MAGKFALIIGNSHYDDSSLSRLKAPDVDVRALEEVLKAPEVGRFDEVTTLLNEGCAAVRKAVARFYDQRKRDDLLLLYFSGHGVKDEQGHLYLALRDTESALLAGTAIETAFITARMDRSFSKRQVLVLDCCHSGAFANGAKAAQGVSVGTAEAFEGLGVGRVVLTATDSTQYAWEGDQIIGDAQSSLFTHFLIDGLKTGEADRDNDGVVTVDELYDYVREQVINTTPRQTPYKWTYRQQGDIILAQNPRLKRSALPPEIEEAINSKLSGVRLEAVRDLAVMLRGHHAGRARAALAALKNLSVDDSRKVAKAAVEALSVYDEEERQQRVHPHLAEEGKAETREPFAEPAPTQQDLSDRVAAAATAALPVDPDTVRELDAEIQKAVAAEAAWRNPEPPASTDERIEGLASDIFLSYAREDRDKARALAKVLGARGWRVWWDRKIAPGEAFDVVIERELCTCKCAIVLWSANSVNATWVRNEARRASRRRVLVPILIDPVETPLEFENLQAADLTSWEIGADHPELEAVFDRVQALAPIPYDRLARSAVENARSEFAAGRRQAALASLEQFRPAHDLVTRAIADLRAEAERSKKRDEDNRRKEDDRRKAEDGRKADAAQRQQELVAEKTRIETLLVRAELDAAERALATAEKRFESAGEFGPLLERLQILRGHAQHERLARRAVEDARRDFVAGHRQAALASLEQFRPAHDVVTRALAELREEADRFERERAERARREAEAAQGLRELAAERSLIEGFLERSDLDAADRALATAEETFESSAEFGPLRERLQTLRSQRQAEADRIERERAEAARRAAEDAKPRQEGSDTIRVRVEKILDRVELRAGERTAAPVDANVAAEAHPETPSWSVSRPLQVAAGVAALLAVIVGTWLGGIWPRRPDVRQDPSPRQVSERSTPAPVPSTNPSTPGTGNTGTSTPPESNTAKPTPNEAVQPPAAPVPEIPRAPNEPAPGPTGKQTSPSGTLAELRTRASTLVQSGQREQALSTVLEGLKIDPKDKGLRSLQDSLQRDARAAAERSKQEAVDVNADDRAEEAYRQGLQSERQALAHRRAGRIDAATRSFWAAADQFKAAAAEARRVEEDEKAEQARFDEQARKQKAAVAQQKPNTDAPADRKSPNLAAEQELVTESLRRYEDAYTRLNVGAVRSVYPSGPIDQLAKEFAGYSSYTYRFRIEELKFYFFSETRASVVVSGRATHDIVPKSGQGTKLDRTEVFTLEKQGKTWIIVHMKVAP